MTELRPRLDRAVIAGGLIVPPGDAVHDDVWRALRTPNPAYRSWTMRRKGPPPPETVTPDVRVTDGPWSGAVVLPRCSPVDVLRRADRLASPECGADVVRAMSAGYRPRPHQVAAVAAVEAAGGGMVVAPAGSGKTDIGVILCSRNRTPAVIIAPTIDIMKQWRARILGGDGQDARIPGASVGLVGAGKDERDADIVVASVKTLVRWGFSELYEWGKGRGLVIYDECHHAAAPTDRQVLAALPGAMRVGLTATPERKDGLTDWVSWLFGPVVYRISQQDMQDQGRVLRPRIQVVRTGYVPMDGEDVQPVERVTALTEDTSRNVRVVASIASELRAGRRVLALTERREHTSVIAEMLQQGGHNAYAVDGSMAAKGRGSVLADFRSGAVSCVVATQLADEGLDVPECDCVALMVPSSHRSRTEQRIGRGLRPSPGKNPLVLDFLDEGEWAMRKRSARGALFRALGWV